MILSVAYHSEAALRTLAADLSRQSLAPSRWLVVDNSPRSAPLGPAVLTGGDAVLAGLPLEVLSGREGDGFGEGCNRGFAHLERQGWSGWVWLLNPDIRLPRGDELERLAAALLSLPPRGVVGTAVRDPRGQLEGSGGWLDPGLDFRRRRLTESHATGGGAALAVDWLSGCSLALRPTAHTPPARFDPAFPLYYEDMDLCLRLARDGAPILWLPTPAVGHGRGAGSVTPGTRRLRLSTLSYVRFLRRHRPGWVLRLRGLRLLLNALLRLPLQPQRGLAALQGLAQAVGSWPATAVAPPPEPEPGIDRDGAEPA